MIRLFDPANNDSGPKRVYESRLLYKTIVTNSIQQMRQRNRYIDLWYDQPLYGKINLQGDAVYSLPESTLKQLPAPRNLFAIDFVAEAFNDMRAFLTDAIEKGSIPASIGDLNDLSPKKAWSSSAALYDDHLDTLRALFTESYLIPHENHITNFKDILPLYNSFVKNHAKDFPLLYSTFIESDLCPPQTTGLIIELLESRHGDEGVNLDMFNAFGFDKFVSTAAKYGFYVNQNAPWALVANLSSPRMHKYMADFGLDRPGDFFNEYCWPAYRLDMDLMKEFLYGVYNAFVSNRPKGKMRRVSNLAGFNVQRFTREPLTEERFDAILDDEFWFRTLVMIKKEELQLDLHPTTVNRLIERVLYFNNTNENMDAALRHMNMFFKKRNPKINKLLSAAPNLNTRGSIVLPISAITPTPMVTSVIPSGGGSSY